MSDDLHTSMKHSEHGGEWEAPTALVDYFKARGWEVMDDTPAPVDSADAEAVFDPTEHTVAEVTEHVATNPDDADRVLEAERAGKNRVTLTGESAEAE
jgi:hypothetical protein